MKKLILLLFIPLLSFSQGNWKEEDYFKWNHTNFRQNQLFNQPFSVSKPDYLILDAVLYYLTNEERAKFGLPTLPYHRLLEIAAYNHSMKMATTNFFSHRNPIENSRSTTEKRGKLAGISNPKFAENIAYNYPMDNDTYLQVGELLITQWMNSKGHRSNILSDKAKQMAVGTYYLNGRIYGTQVFQWFYFIIDSPNGSIDKLPTN